MTTVEVLITASPEFFEKKSRKEIREFFAYAVEFMKSKQNPDTYISAAVHVDEKTPHMHLCFVPITPDGRLSAKEIIGNKKRLTKWQDEFWSYIVKKYPDFERGESASLAAKEMRGEIADLRKAVDRNKASTLRQLELEKKVQELDGLQHMVEVLRQTMDAMSRQGQRTDLTSRQVVGKSETADLIADNKSGRQVQRYIRLTELIPEILQMVDDGKIALTPAVELSYLTKQEQHNLLETMESEDCTPSLSRAIQLKKLSQAGELDMDKIFEILREPKANQQDKISFRVEDLRKFFPKSCSAARIQETILKLLSEYQKKRQRAQER